MTPSQLLSGMIALAGLVESFIRFKGETLFDFCLITAIILALIWFPDTVNTYTVGLWVDGYKVENPTPPAMIAGFGWIVLIAINGLLLGLF